MADGLRDEVDALDVDARDLVVDGFAEFVLAVRILRVDEQARDVDAGIVHEDVDAAELRFRCRDHRRDALRIRDVHDAIEERSAALVDVERRLVRIHIADDDVRAVIEERLRDSLADAGRAARDDRCFSF